MKLLRLLILVAAGLLIARLTSQRRLTIGNDGVDGSGTRPEKRKAKSGVNRSVLRRQAESERHLAAVAN